MSNRDRLAQGRQPIWHFLNSTGQGGPKNDGDSDTKPGCPGPASLTSQLSAVPAWTATWAAPLSCQSDILLGQFLP